jgi:hypothetical protein
LVIYEGIFEPNYGLTVVWEDFIFSSCSKGFIHKKRKRKVKVCLKVMLITLISIIV